MANSKRGEFFLDRVKNLIRNVPDFPKQGIIFKDITPLLKDPEGFNTVINKICEKIEIGRAHV